MNEAKVITWLCVLWMLPQEVFTVPGRTRGGRAGRKSRYHRIHHTLNDATLLSRLAARAEAGAQAESDPSVDSRERSVCAAGAVRDADEGDQSAASLSQLLSSSSSSSPLAVGLPGPPAAEAPAALLFASKPTADSTVALRVEHLFQLGHVQRAMRSLVSTTGKADLDQPAERDALRALHHPCSS